MQVKRLIRPWIGGALFTILCLGLAGTPPEAGAQPVILDARLIHASDRPVVLDPRLRAFEPKLRRIFRFQSFGILSQTRTPLRLPADARVDLGQGYRLHVRAVALDPRRVRADIEWFRGATRLLRTSVTQQRGVPAMLGGPPHDGGTVILVLEFQ